MLETIITQIPTTILHLFKVIETENVQNVAPSKCENDELFRW